MTCNCFMGFIVILICNIPLCIGSESGQSGACGSGNPDVQQGSPIPDRII